MSNEIPGNSLAAPLGTLPGATPSRLELLARLGLHTVGDLLFHFPRTYEDLTDLRPISALAQDVAQTVQGEVVEMEGRTLPDGRCIVSVVISDDGVHCLEGVWFNQAYAARRFRFGQRLSFSGKPKWRRDHWQMISPRVQALDGGGVGPTPGVVPVYPLTDGLRPEHLRPLIGKSLDLCAAQVVETLPASIRGLHDWPGVAESLRAVHFPASAEEATRGRRRFIYEEFFLLQLALASRRREVRERGRAPILPAGPIVDAHIRRLFPFALTADQDKAVAEICADLSTERPMQRLVQADVGSGKTAVAVYALLVTVANKHQAALMVPTEVLARQHFRTLERYLAHSRVRRLLLTGGLSPRERREALEGLRTGAVDLVVGTQSLVGEEVEFAKLGLVVVDEQHRFGVHQRARFRRLGAEPHYLVMTATPIPRTVALSVFGDLDVSVMKQLPPGRRPVVTRWQSADQRERVYARLREALTAGRQGYVVCPLVEESASLELKAATETHAQLQVGPFRDFRLGLLHGRQDEATKDDVMRQFRAGEIQLLVCTTVIEVGIDVPNATMLIVEHAERLGLSQLHQLRGRVSRGPTAGECHLFAEPANEEGKKRLQAIVRWRDGFALAEEDLRQRGVGEFFGARQHGLGELRFGDLIADADLMSQARRDAFSLAAADPGLRRPQHAALRAEVWRRYGETLDLAEVG